MRRILKLQGTGRSAPSSATGSATSSRSRSASTLTPSSSSALRGDSEGLQIFNVVGVSQITSRKVLARKGLLIFPKGVKFIQGPRSAERLSKTFISRSFWTLGNICFTVQNVYFFSNVNKHLQLRTMIYTFVTLLHTGIKARNQHVSQTPVDKCYYSTYFITQFRDNGGKGILCPVFQTNSVVKIRRLTQGLILS